jgi:uncharacterized protein YndB with AHSA1/START domain
MQSDAPPAEAFSQAPEMLHGEATFAAPLALVFEWVTEPDRLKVWLPLIQTGWWEPDTGGDVAPGHQRILDCGPRGQIVEVIRHWDPPRAMAYSIVASRMSVRDHAATMSLAPAAGGGTTLVWRQHFHPAGFFPRLLLPPALARFQTRGFGILARELGGAGGRVRRIR